MSRWALCALLVASSAAAEGRRVVVDAPAPAQPAGAISHTIVLERCHGGCTITKNGQNNATQMTSTIPQGAGPFTVAEFNNANGMPGAPADADWAAILRCVQEVYSPYDITVTDQRPAGSTYHLAIVAGVPAQVGLPSDILGIAPLTGDCSPVDNVISYSFANAHSGADRLTNLCWTVAQESAHAFGLDHEFMFVDGKSACTDPMTYRNDCGGQHFFRNQSAKCGEFDVRPCKCSATQNSHAKLLALFGPGQTLVAPPTSEITFPQPGATTLPAVVGVKSGSQRGVAKVELLFNGFVWASAEGAPFGAAGQKDPTDYSVAVPANLPKSIVDIVARASDDLGAFTDSPTITVTNGAPCANAESCAAHQKCDGGRCLWDAPSAELGDSCEYPQFCKSGICQATSDGKYCSEACTPDTDPSTCPDDLVCAVASEGEGLCVPPSSGGCCDTGGSSTGSGVLAFVGLGWIMRRRRGFAGVRASARKRDESC